MAELERLHSAANFVYRSSGCSTVGRAVASNIRDTRFKSSHQQFLLTNNCIEKTIVKNKEAENGPNLNKNVLGVGPGRRRVPLTSVLAVIHAEKYFLFILFNLKSAVSLCFAACNKV